MNTPFPQQYPGRGEVVPSPRPTPSDAIDYWSYVLALWRGKYLIAATGLAAAVAMAAASFTVTPVFTAKTQILLTTRQAQVINIANVVDNPEYTDTAILSELTIILSPPILAEVTQRLNLASVPEFNPDLQEPDPIADTIKALRQGFRDLINPPSGDSEAASPEAVAAGILSGKVSVSQFGTSYILEIQAQSQYPKLAAAIANTVAEVYIESQIEEKLDANQRAVDWLTDTELSLRGRLQETERALEVQRAALFPNDVLSLDVLNQQRGALTGALVTANADRAAAMARAERFDALVGEGDLSAAMQFGTSNRLAGLVEKREAARQQRSALARRDESRSADIAQLDIAVAEAEAQIADEAAQISRGLAAQIEATEARAASLRGDLLALERIILEATISNLDLSAAQRELDAKRAVYDRVLNRLTETRERGELQDPDAKVVSAAWPPEAPSAPKRALLTMLGLVLGCGAASGWVLLREARREIFRTGDEVEAKTGAPVIAVLPKGLARARGSWMLAPPIEASAALRKMRTLLDASHRDGAARLILATSVLPGEGAPELCVALARICAEDGQRAVIVDCLPIGDSKLKGVAVPPESGADGRTLRNFHVMRFVSETMHGGRRRPFAEEFQDAVSKLLVDYDRIILCAPPVLVGSNIFAVARHVDAALLGFRWEATPQGAVMDALADLRKLGAPLAGLVMTETDFSTAAAYGYAGAGAVGRKLREFAGAD